MSKLVELHATDADWEHLCRHVFTGDRDEHGAVLLCGIAEGDAFTRLLVRDVVLAVDGVDYLPGLRGYRHLDGAFVTHQARRARDQGLAYIAVHNHGGTTSVGFSGPDLTSHERAYPTLLGLIQRPVGALVLAEDAVAGDIWFPNGRRVPLGRTVVVGSSRQVLTPDLDLAEPTVAARYQRQSLLFGAVGQRILSDSKVAVVGAGGVGMLLVQGLARLGVGNLVVIDPERVDITNLPRLPEASRRDAMEYLARVRLPAWVRKVARSFAAPKVQVARGIVRRANPDAKFEGLVGDIADDDVARRVTDCDFIFLAADSMLARSVVNQISYQYLVPALQVGSKPVIEPISGAILDVFGVVRTLGTHPGCLSCTGLIDPTRLGEEALGDTVQMANQRYVDDPEVEAASVITLNAMGAGWAANDFMQFMVGLGRPSRGFRILRIQPPTSEIPHVVVQEPEVDRGCLVCGSSDRSVRSMGDGRELPTRIRS